MLPGSDIFERSIREQIAINMFRTPSERFQALCELLDAARAMAPMDPEAIARRRRALAAHQRRRERDREQLRAFLRRELMKRRAIVLGLVEKQAQGEADLSDLKTAYGEPFDRDFIDAELERFIDPEDPRRSKFEEWLRKLASSSI